ncbi:MAG TPA: Do family serine endopeptidase [Xanthobacteraceae bacterium]|nr:Do family serine endopeptidase [Xanthobacteraceae bacterium]
MNPNDFHYHRPPSRLTVRRFALLASVAVVAGGLLAAGPGGFEHMTGFTAPAQAAEAVHAQSQTPASFADLVAKVKPAVISVRVKITPEETTGSGGGDVVPFKNDVPMQKFFQQFGFGNLPNGARPHQVIMGEGSGFFISPDGYAVTNNHVVDHATSVQVTTDNGKTYTAKVIGTDPKTDLALIKVDGQGNFPYVQFADQAPRVGDWVVAVGNPFGLGGTVTAGIVSARGRDIGAGPYDDYIQIDAPINKGNSGGPAFDTQGRVIGVNTAIYSPSGGSVGIGFDIPAETAKMVVAQLKEHGHVTRGWMGVQVQPVTADIADSLGLKQPQGAIVDQPQPNSPAEKAGIKAGDVITAINGTPVKDSRDLARRIGATAPGTSVKLDIVRDGHDQTVQLTLGELPTHQQAKVETHERASPTAGVPHLGVELAPANEVEGAGDHGVVVMGVEANSAAAEHGLRTGDVILSIGSKQVSSPDDVRNALVAAKKDGRHDVLLRVKTADAAPHFVAVPLG